jgi:hypothetical protein
MAVTPGPAAAPPEPLVAASAAPSGMLPKRSSVHCTPAAMKKSVAVAAGTRMPRAYRHASALSRSASTGRLRQAGFEAGFET